MEPRRETFGQPVDREQDGARLGGQLLLMERSADMIVALLAIMKVGGAYAPVARRTGDQPARPETNAAGAPLASSTSSRDTTPRRPEPCAGGCGRGCRRARRRRAARSASARRTSREVRRQLEQVVHGREPFPRTQELRARTDPLQSIERCVEGEIAHAGPGAEGPPPIISSHAAPLAHPAVHCVHGVHVRPRRRRAERAAALQGRLEGAGGRARRPREGVRPRRGGARGLPRRGSGEVADRRRAARVDHRGPRRAAAGASAPGRREGGARAPPRRPRRARPRDPLRALGARARRRHAARRARRPDRARGDRQAGQGGPRDALRTGALAVARDRPRLRAALERLALREERGGEELQVEVRRLHGGRRRARSRAPPRVLSAGRREDAAEHGLRARRQLHGRPRQRLRSEEEERDAAAVPARPLRGEQRRLRRVPRLAAGGAARGPHAAPLDRRRRHRPRAAPPPTSSTTRWSASRGATPTPTRSS